MSKKRDVERAGYINIEVNSTRLMKGGYLLP